MIESSQRRVSLLLLITLASASFTSAFSQHRGASKKPAAAAPCTLGIADAPTIRGLRLGMTVDDFLELFPSASSRAVGNDQEVGRERFDVNAEENAEFADVQINQADFIDGKLASLMVVYPDFSPENDADFVRQASAKLGLPKVGWRRKDRNSLMALSCNGFTVSLTAHVYGHYRGLPYLVLEDNVAIAKVAAREKALIEQRRRAERERRRLELERIRREERESRTFKP